MNAFTAEVADRVAAAQASLAQARSSGDDYLASIRVGELESLARLVREHDLDVPGLDVAQAPESVIDLRWPAEADATRSRR